MANTNVTTPLAQKAPVTLGRNVAPTTNTSGSSTAPSAVHATITKFQFRKLFTVAERVAVDNAQYSGKLSGPQKAMIATITKDLDSSGSVELGTADVTQGVMYLVSVHLLDLPRAQRILANLQPI